MAPMDTQKWNSLTMDDHLIAKKMKEFSKSKDIQNNRTEQYYPNSNLAETFMKILSNATKIEPNRKEDKTSTIRATIKNYIVTMKIH